MSSFDLRPLRVFSSEREALPLRTIQEALKADGFPATIGIGIAGDADDDTLSSTDWDAAFVRWNTPEVHEVYLIERNLAGDDELADAAIADGLKRAANSDDPAGQLIVADQMRRTVAVYDCQLLPALLADEDHPAWAALDTVLRTLAGASNGLIYVEAEGFCDADGELILAESDENTFTLEQNRV